MIKLNINKSKLKTSKRSKENKKKAKRPKSKNKNNLKPLKPSRREKNRYVLFQIIKGINDFDLLNSLNKEECFDFVKHIEKKTNKEFEKKTKSTYINLFGIFDYAKLGFRTILPNKDQKKIIEKNIQNIGFEFKQDKDNKNNNKKESEKQEKGKKLKSQIGILKIKRNNIDKLRTSFLFTDFLDDEKVIIRTLKTSGTIKALINLKKRKINKKQLEKQNKESKTKKDKKQKDKKKQ